MTLINQFYMDLDLKRRFERYVATFRSGDTVELIMSIFDNGKEYDISSAKKATIYQKTCSGVSLKGEGTFDMINGKRVIRYTLDKLYTIETGFNTMILVLEDGDTEISIQPFSIYINDDLTSTSGSYIELIQDLMKLVEELTLELNNTIKLEEKGSPNGVATLDENGKIPLNQIPPMFDSFLEHIPQTVYKDQVHGMRINNDGILQHETEPNTWVDTGIGTGESGGGGGNEDFLNVYITITKGIVNLRYVGVPSVSSQKWSLGEQTQSYFNNNGASFTGNSFGVSQVGMHTLWYRDSNGNTYTKVFEVKNEDLDITEVTIEIQDGVVTVTPDKSISLKKWALGQRDIAYFQNEGNVFTGNSFEINSTGTYTVYLKDTNGIESVHVFMANAFDLRDYFTVNVVNGVATITYLIPVLEEHTKWSKGLQNESYFEGNGTPVVNATFNVTEIGDYTVRIATDPDRIVRLGAFKVTEDMLAPPEPPSIYAPIFVETEVYSASGVNDVAYRLKFPLDDVSVRASYSGFDTNRPDNYSESEFYISDNMKTPRHIPYINRSSDSTDMMMYTYDENDNLIHVLHFVGSAQFNYVNVDNSYIIFLKPKSNSVSYRIPDTIEGLPVKDIGATLFIQDEQNINISELIIPVGAVSGGRFASNAENLSKITIESPVFKFNHIDFALTNNKNGWKVYAPNSSDTYIKLLDNNKPVIGY